MTVLGRVRFVELGLLLPAALVALAGAAILLLERGAQLTTTTLLPAIALVALFVAAHLWLTVRLPAADATILPIAAVLTALGMTLVGRIEPTLAPKQLAWLVVSLAAWAIVIAFPRPVAWLERYRYSWAVLGVVLLVSTLALGVDPNGSGVRVWLGFGGYYFQPSELLKVLLVVFLAGYLAEAREMLGAVEVGRPALFRSPSLAYLLPIVLMAGVALALFLVQRDLGPAVLVFAVTLAMLYLATGRVVYVLGGALGFAAGAYVCYRAFSVVRLRVDLWLDPWSQASDRGYQIIQGLVAFANGGIMGTGIGYGHPEILPAAHTDFPFAVLGEDLGLVGTLAVLGVFLVLAMRGYSIAAHSRGGFAMLLAAGLITVIALQTLIIMAGNLKLLPLTGITLPFVSYGGSSLLTNFLILGLLHRVSAEARARG